MRKKRKSRGNKNIIKLGKIAIKSINASGDKKYFNLRLLFEPSIASYCVLSTQVQSLAKYSIAKIATDTISKTKNS